MRYALLVNVVWHPDVYRSLSVNANLITTLNCKYLSQDEFYASLFNFASFEITCCVGAMEQIW